MKIILGSKSPRRKEILEMAGFDFKVLVSDVDENVSETKPEDKVIAIALRKANAIFDIVKDNMDDKIIVCADTIVVTNDGEVLEKPKDKEDARRMISDIQGTFHYVYTAYVIKSKEKEVKGLEKTEVYVVKMSEDEIEEYINMKEPYDKAGAYAIQGFFGKYISHINGDYYNVMGLPLCKICQEIKKF